MEAYLDNSSTTRISDSVLEKMIQVYRIDYGNPSAMHSKGFDAEKYIKEAKDIIAGSLKVSPKEIFFTSGGTESNNLAIIGSAMANKRLGNKILTTPIEHPSVGNTVNFLKEQGFEVDYIPVDGQGLVDLKVLEELMTPETILVSVMHVNNEIGSVQPVEEIGKIIKKINPSVVFHVDAIQSFGKFQIRPKKAGIDLLSVSGHKIHGPKGVGFLYIKEKTKINPLILGGGQQDGMRSGTENVPGVAGLGQAVKESYENFDEKIDRLYALRAYFTEELKKIDGCYVNGPSERKAAPQIVSVSFEGVRAEVLLHSLEEKNIFVSAGSACSSHKRAPSATLSAIGIRKDLLESTVRFSFNLETSKEELDYTLAAIKELLPMLRRYARH